MAWVVAGNFGHFLYREHPVEVCVHIGNGFGTFDTPLLYMGQMAHHPIVLCDNREENNHRPVYSWIMNNTWETNFKMDLSGFGEFVYSIELSGEGSLEKNLGRLADNDMGTEAFIVE